MNNWNKKTKIVVSSIATIFLVALYCLIFNFSEQDGETSGGLSRMITERFVEILNTLNGKTWSRMMLESMADYFENPIRKLAHFCEYAVMGGLLFFIWYPWIGWCLQDNKNAFTVKTNTEKIGTRKAGITEGNTENTRMKVGTIKNSEEKEAKGKKKIPLLAKSIIPWVFISAAFDELHQLFIPGRCGNFWDVLLDTSGGVFGLVGCVWFMKLSACRKKRKNKKKEAGKQSRRSKF